MVVLCGQDFLDGEGRVEVAEDKSVLSKPLAFLQLYAVTVQGMKKVGLRSHLLETFVSYFNFSGICCSYQRETEMIPNAFTVLLLLCFLFRTPAFTPPPTLTHACGRRQLDRASTPPKILARRDTVAVEILSNAGMVNDVAKFFTDAFW